jgi:hypothetical protein
MASGVSFVSFLSRGGLERGLRATSDGCRLDIVVAWKYKKGKKFCGLVFPFPFPSAGSLKENIFL